VTQTNSDTKVSRAYDGGIIILGALLLIAAIVAAVWLLSVAINDAPVVSAIFGILFVVFCAASVIGYAAQTRWAITQNANVHIQVANSLGQALAQYKSQNPQIAAPTVYAEPARQQIADVRRHFNGGLPPGVSGARVSDGATEYVATTASLVAALDLLAEGKSPTRSNFREKGIYSSTEVSGAVNFMASLGYVDPVVQGAPADWASSVMPSDVGAIADHLRGYVPALPVFQPVFAEIAPQAGQAGSKAGRGRGRK
jgi:hypothetical protein